MKLLWFTWKDSEHPLAGGAEVVNHELAARLVADGHEVTFIVGGFIGGESETHTDGYRVIRMPGGRFMTYWHAYRYYVKNLKGWADVVIDEINTIPFFCKFYVKEKNMLFVHQLAREIWFHEMFFPLNVVGYLLEPIYLLLLSDRQVITVSQSSSKDLQRFGFKAKNIHIISEGIQLEPLSDLSSVQKFESPTLLSVGAIRSMKQTHQKIKAFEIAKKAIPELQLIIAGKPLGTYGERVQTLVAQSPYRDSIQLLGAVSPQKKQELMQKSHLLLVTSIKEGWGLVVTEAASQGTPAVVYDSDGLRDSVKNGTTGIVCSRNPAALAAEISSLLKDPERLEQLRVNAWEFSKQITFAKGYTEFKEILSHA